MSPALVQVISRGFACSYASAAPCRCISPLWSGDVGCVTKTFTRSPLRALQYSNDSPSLAVNFLYSPPSLNPLTLMSDQDRISQAFSFLCLRKLNVKVIRNVSSFLVSCSSAVVFTGMISISSFFLGLKCEEHQSNFETEHKKTHSYQ